ncbi:FecR domain-containing protein [Pacificimonas sp. WHA3]|uniref:FecR domain-containing protein n=1 Tax=Pacificimonas pallii TaxID=2827236 RepID=A0ABS6SB33_9SPHN|nr:FecR domain-containing protein [Pacificimonas pallii]MBV7255624.1 FecR domain-containing protein [Pacificimonas pallii]
MEIENRRDAADRAAAQWMARRDSGRFSQADADEFARWLAAHPAHAEAWSRYELLDEHLNAATALRFERELETLANAEVNAKPQRRWLVPAVGAVAAMGAAVIAISVMTDGAKPLSYETAHGERREVTLADGSVAALNSGSRLEVAFAGDERRVRLLSGEALFDVTRDAGRPFVVEGGPGVIHVVGTQFNVALASATGRDEALTVSVLSGVVRVSAARETFAAAMLLAGERLAMTHAGKALPKETFDAAFVTDWREGRARFAETPLRDVIAELNLHFSQPLALESAALGDVPVTGTFSLDAQDASVSALESALQLTAEPQADGRLVLTGNAD